jgi:hypothetical protein
MAQTGYTPILIYSSSTTTNAPAVGNLTNSTLGSELAINITDGKLFYKDNANAIQVIGWKTVPATAGGTGQTVYAVGDILYASTTTALSKLADVATGNALISGGVGVAPSYGKIGLTTHVSGTLPVGNGGTGLTAVTAGYIPFGNSATALNTDAGLFWDNTNKRLGIGTASPALEVDISVANAGDGLRVRNTQNSGFADLRVGNDAQANLGFLRVGGSTYGGIYQNTFTMATGGGYTIQIAPQGTLNTSFFPAGGVSIGNTTDPGAGNLNVNSNVNIAQTTAISGAKLTVNGQIATSPFTAINSSTATTIATCVSCLAVLRDRGSGGTALVLYDNTSSPAVVVVSQTGGSKFTASAPSATQIQIANGGNSLTALSGSSIGTTNLNICILQNQ